MKTNINKGITVPKSNECLKIDQPKLSAQAQKFGISMNKGFIGYWASSVFGLHQLLDNWIN